MDKRDFEGGEVADVAAELTGKSVTVKGEVPEGLADKSGNLAVKDDARGDGAAGGTDGEERPRERSALFKAAFGALIGFLNGIFGGGGGMVAVPFLQKGLGKSAKRAHATAILLILPISAASAAVYVTAGSFRPAVGIPAVLGVVAGGICGACLLSRLSNKFVSVLFALIMVAAGLKMLF